MDEFNKKGEYSKRFKILIQPASNDDGSINYGATNVEIQGMSTDIYHGLVQALKESDERLLDIFETAVKDVRRYEHKHETPEKAEQRHKEFESVKSRVLEAVEKGHTTIEGDDLVIEDDNVRMVGVNLAKKLKGMKGDRAKLMEMIRKEMVKE